jgi:hypothetical protein
VNAGAYKTQVTHAGFRSLREGECFPATLLLSLTWLLEAAKSEELSKERYSREESAREHPFWRILSRRHLRLFCSCCAALIGDLLTIRSGDGGGLGDLTVAAGFRRVYCRLFTVWSGDGRVLRDLTVAGGFGRVYCRFFTIRSGDGCVLCDLAVAGGFGRVYCRLFTIRSGDVVSFVT